MSIPAVPYVHTRDYALKCRFKSKIQSSFRMNWYTFRGSNSTIFIYFFFSSKRGQLFKKRICSFRVDPIFEGLPWPGKKKGSLKSCSSRLNNRNTSANSVSEIISQISARNLTVSLNSRNTLRCTKTLMNAAQIELKHLPFTKQ